MPHDFLPSRESELVTWSLNFKTLITATPTAYGLTALLATAYGALHDSFVTLYNASQADGTRTPAGIIAKDEAKSDLKANARELAGIVQKCPTVTNEQRSELGLNVRAEKHPIPAPSSSPNIDIVEVSGHIVTLRLHDPANPTRRGKPAGVAGAAVFSYVGAEAPTDISDFKFEGNTTQMTLDVEFGASVAAGAKVWFTAFYFSPRHQSGPATTPISTWVQYGGVSEAV